MRKIVDFQPFTDEDVELRIHREIAGLLIYNMHRGDVAHPKDYITEDDILYWEEDCFGNPSAVVKPGVDERRYL